MTHESDNPAPSKSGYLRSKWSAWHNFERLIVVVVIAAAIIFSFIWLIGY